MTHNYKISKNRWKAHNLWDFHPYSGHELYHNISGSICLTSGSFIPYGVRLHTSLCSRFIHLKHRLLSENYMCLADSLLKVYGKIHAWAKLFFTNIFTIVITETARPTLSNSYACKQFQVFVNFNSGSLKNRIPSLFKCWTSQEGNQIRFNVQ